MNSKLSQMANTTRDEWKGLDNPKCVIYQGTVTSTENEKRKIVKATSVQKDVLDCLDIVEGNFV